MTTAGPEAYNFVRSGNEAGREKLELILHLLTNLPQSLVLLAPRGAGKTALMRQIQAQALPFWNVYYLLATPNHGFERILDEMSHMLRRPGQPAADDDPESALTEQLAQLEKQGRALVLLLDDAGVLMPGLLSALCRYSRLHGALKLVFSLRPEELKAKAVGDALALADAHPVTLAEAGHTRAASAHSPSLRLTMSPPVPSATPAPSFVETLRVRWIRPRFKPVYGLITAAVALAAVVGAMVHFLWRDELKPLPATAQPASSQPVAVTSPPPEPRIEPQPVPPQSVAVPEPKPPEPLLAPLAPSATPPESAVPTAPLGASPEAAQSEPPKPAAKSKTRKKRRH